MRHFPVWIALVLTPALGCGTTTPPIDAARVDAGDDAADVGHDANDLDVGSDANDLDANDLDGGVDADLDANDFDATDAFVPVDIGPFDAAIHRTADPPTHPSATPIAPFTECTVSTFTDTIEGAEHRDPCDEIPYPSYPPSAGPHYWVWASFLTYHSPVPWPFMVHSLEHGAVVLAYHCENDADCDAVRAEFAAIIASEGVDPVCRMETTDTRFIIVPDPSLPVPIAAVAWRNVYEATCLDPVSLRAFVTAHYGMGTEAFCFAGEDRSDGGWCP